MSIEKFSWWNPLIWSGVFMGVERFVGEGLHDTQDPLAAAAAIGAVVAGVASEFFVGVAHSKLEKAELRALTSRNHHLRRGMVEALLESLARVPKPAGEV